MTPPRRQAAKRTDSSVSYGQQMHAELNRRPAANRQCIPILTFHSIDDTGSPISVSPLQFKRQMEDLWVRGWSTCNLDELVQGYHCGQWPEHSFMLTFDDGFVNFATQALPVLCKHGFSATVFVTTDWVGRTNDWPGQPGWVPRSALMDWNALRMISKSGMGIGAHSCSHADLTRAGSAQKEREVLNSAELIEQQIGRPVQSFAYPYGAVTQDIEGMVAARYKAGFGTSLGFMTCSSRLVALERIDMFYLRDRRCLAALDSRWLHSYLVLRHRLRQWKHRLTSNRRTGNQA